MKPFSKKYLKQADTLSDPITPYKDVEDRGSKEVSIYEPEYKFLVNLIKLINKVAPQAIPEIKDLATKYPFTTIDEVGDLAAKIWTLATEKYNVPRAWLVKNLPEKNIKGNLNKRADTKKDYWVTPQGELIPMEGITHEEYLVNNISGQDIKDLDADEINEVVWEYMREGWTRIYGAVYAQFGIESADDTHLPSYIDDIVAKLYNPNDEIPIEVGSYGSTVTIKDPIPNLQKAVNKALQNKRIGNKKIADLWPAQESSEVTITQSPGAIAYNNPKDTTVSGPNPNDVVKQSDEEISCAKCGHKKIDHWWSGQPEAWCKECDNEGRKLCKQYIPKKANLKQASPETDHELFLAMGQDVIDEYFFGKSIRWSQVVSFLKEQVPQLTDEDIATLKTDTKMKLSQFGNQIQSKKKSLNIDKVVKVLNQKEPKVVRIDTSKSIIELEDGSSITFEEAINRAMDLDKTSSRLQCPKCKSENIEECNA